MRSIGRTPSSNLISQKTISATSKIARLLRIQEGEGIIEITRLRMADGEPILLETSCLSLERFPSLTNFSWNENESLYQVLSDEYDVNCDWPRPYS